MDFGIGRASVEIRNEGGGVGMSSGNGPKLTPEQKLAQMRAAAKAITEPKQAPRKKVAPAPQLRPPTPGKAIQNQDFLDRAAAQRNAAAAKGAAPPAAGPPQAKRDFARAAAQRSGPAPDKGRSRSR